MKVLNAITFILVFGFYLYTFLLLATDPRPPLLVLIFMLTIYLGGILGFMYWLRLIVGKGKSRLLDWPWRD